MDGSRFDSLTRAAASAPSRRALLGAALGGLAATLVGRGAEAAVLRGPGQICRKHGDCASGLCNAADHTGRRYCGCTDASQCPPPHAGDPCQTATCDGGTCGIGVNVGAICDDGDACTTGDTCQADGSCGGGTATECTALDPCHTAGTCDPATGACTNPNASDGITCETGNRCTADTCDGQGACVQGADVVTPTCPTPNQCQISVGCNPATGECDQVVNRTSGFPCGAGPSCSDGTQHAQDACDGGGACVPGANTGCGLFVCGTTSCRTICDTDADCVGAAHCDGGNCVTNLANGQPCDEPSDCQSGICNATSGICCGQSCGAGVACVSAGSTCGAPPCGGLGQVCCLNEGGRYVCDAGLQRAAVGYPDDCRCDASCGADDEPCCLSDDGHGVSCGVGCCHAPFNGETACRCGGEGECCCPGNACDGTLQCNNFGRCMASCGSRGEPCCGGDPLCDSGLYCGTQGCVECIPDGELATGPCCSGIHSGYLGSQCGPCGHLGEACCNDEGGTFSCLSGDLLCSGGRCVNCGGAGEPCCAGVGHGDPCDSPDVLCNSRRQFTCERCGEAGNLCCPGDVCNSGLTCQALGCFA